MTAHPPTDSPLGREMSRQAEYSPSFARWLYLSGYEHLLSEEQLEEAKAADSEHSNGDPS